MRVNKKDFYWKVAYLLMAGGVFLVDQATKAWAIRRLRFGGDKEIIPGSKHRKRRNVEAAGRVVPGKLYARR